MEGALFVGKLRGVFIREPWWPTCSENLLGDIEQESGREDCGRAAVMGTDGFLGMARVALRGLRLLGT